MIGTGYLGLVSGMCFAGFGPKGICVDTRFDRVDIWNAGLVPILEAKHKALTRRNVEAARAGSILDIPGAVLGENAGVALTEWTRGRVCDLVRVARGMVRSLLTHRNDIFDRNPAPKAGFEPYVGVAR